MPGDFLGRLARAEERDNQKKDEKPPNRFRSQSVESKEEASQPAQPAKKGGSSSLQPPPAKKGKASGSPGPPAPKNGAAAAVNLSELDELRDKMASGHMLTADELTQLEAAAAADEKPSGKAAAAAPAKKAAVKPDPKAAAKPAAGKASKSAASAAAKPAASVPALSTSEAVNMDNLPDGASLDLNDIALAESIFLAEMAASFGGETLSRVNGLIAEARKRAQTDASGAQP